MQVIIDSITKFGLTCSPKFMILNQLELGELRVHPLFALIV